MTSMTKLMKTLSEIVIYADTNSIKTNITSHKCQFAAPSVIFCCLDAQCRIVLALLGFCTTPCKHFHT